MPVETEMLLAARPVVVALTYTTTVTVTVGKAAIDFPETVVDLEVATWLALVLSRDAGVSKKRVVLVCTKPLERDGMLVALVDAPAAVVDVKFVTWRAPVKAGPNEEFPKRVVLVCAEAPARDGKLVFIRVRILAGIGEVVAILVVVTVGAIRVGPAVSLESLLAPNSAAKLSTNCCSTVSGSIQLDRGRLENMFDMFIEKNTKKKR